MKFYFHLSDWSTLKVLHHFVERCQGNFSLCTLLYLGFWTCEYLTHLEIKENVKVYFSCQRKATLKICIIWITKIIRESTLIAYNTEAIFLKTVEVGSVEWLVIPQSFWYKELILNAACTLWNFYLILFKTFSNSLFYMRSQLCQPRYFSGKWPLRLTGDYNTEQLI